MKKMDKNITAASGLKLVSGAFDELENSAYNNGYDLSVGADLIMKLTATKDADHMPTITVKTSIVDDVAVFDPVLTFPTLDNAAEEFYDSISHWLNQWDSLGNLITAIAKFEYDPTRYEED